MIVEIILGFVIALIFVVLVRKWYPKKDHAFWRSGLVIAALIYIIFLLFERNWSWLPIEIGGVILFGIFAMLSKKYSLLWLGIGWIGHIGWDLLIHPGGHPGYVPEWYPGACLGFDIVIGVYVFWLFIERRNVANN